MPTPLLLKSKSGVTPAQAENEAGGPLSHPLVRSNLVVLNDIGIDYELIFITQTQLKKSIIDATRPVRHLLKTKGIHDYDDQLAGPAHRTYKTTRLACVDGIQTTKASLYRPLAKQKGGDPRLWISKLQDWATPHDILAIFASAGALVVANITKIDYAVPEFRANLEEALGDAIVRTSVAEELLAMLHAVAARGPAPGIRSGDTSIGATLEDLLGIRQNSSRAPDYKGIEIKSARDKRKTRKQLFAQVPDWDSSSYKSINEFLEAFGYERDGVYRLNCTVRATSPNSQMLQLFIDQEKGLLLEGARLPQHKHKYLVWPLNTLLTRLKEKHRETFWVTAESLMIDGREHFQFTTVEHTRSPMANQFAPLVTGGIITLDHMIKRKPSGSAHERGPSFKLESSSLGLLFPPSKVYSLMG